MKKSIRVDENNANILNENIHEEISEFDQELTHESINQDNCVKSKNKNHESSQTSPPIDISFSSIVSVIFIGLLIAAVTFKFIFPTIDSLNASITHKKIGQSVVYSYFNLLENTNYAEALKLLDIDGGSLSTDSLLNELQQQFGTTNIVDCSVLNVTENTDYSIVNTVISFLNDGKMQTKNQDILVKNTPKGWKISLNGVIKKFKVDPVSATFNKNLILTLDEIEYCVEGINFKIKVQNDSYSNINMKGKLTLKTTKGSFPANIESLVKPKVNYGHNTLFDSAAGEPIEIMIELEGKDNDERTLPVTIKN